VDLDAEGSNPSTHPKKFVDLCARSSVRIERQPPELKVPRSNRGGRTILLRSPSLRSGELRRTSPQQQSPGEGGPSKDSLGDNTSSGGVNSLKVVFLLRSISAPERSYVGITTDTFRRFAEHNSGASPYSSKYGPWKPFVQITFVNDSRAFAFEKYLKSGSGHAFARRHFW
jgi:putative endonuclease